MFWHKYFLLFWSESLRMLGLLKTSNYCDNVHIVIYTWSASTTHNEDTYLQVLKRMLQNIEKILKKCFLVILWIISRFKTSITKRVCCSSWNGCLFENGHTVINSRYIIYYQYAVDLTSFFRKTRRNASSVCLKWWCL